MIVKFRTLARWTGAVLVSALMMAPAAHAQGQGQVQAQPIPAFRYLVEPDTDFYGDDLGPLFDTKLADCVRACTAQAACQAFTFNSRSNACFPKSGVQRRTEFQGALSAVKAQTPVAVRKLGAERAATLGFLGDADIAAARLQARDLGLTHPTGTVDLQTALSGIQAAASQGQADRAARWTGVAVVLSDRADLWAEYANRLLALQSDDQGTLNANRRRALQASVNAYLRAGDDGTEVSALEIMARALEQSDRGKEMVPALRLATSIQPRSDLEAMLEDAIGKYGFHIVETEVESDSASPRICVQFTDPLVKAGVDYETFVRLPSPSLVVEADGNQLCVDGVDHGERYRITFRKGLPAADGEVLNKDVEITQYVRDRGPSLQFSGQAYLLPKSAGAALPIQTVNVDTVDLTLSRVSDRSLIRAMQEDFFARPMNPWQVDQFNDQIGETVWTGTGEVQNTLNRDMTTRLPLGEALKDQPAGIYVLDAHLPGQDGYDDPRATQWFVLSDLGIATAAGTDGLNVSVRSLADAGAKAGVELTLIGAANGVLGTAVTDDNGVATFAPGLMRGTAGAAPALLLARADDDMGFLALTGPAFDLSDRGVEGRAPAGPVDVFMTTDRGAYRAGETIHATVLARDPEAAAIEDLPLTAILSRPDGMEYLRTVSDGGHAGGHVFSLATGPGVPRGTWRLDIKSDPDGAALASQTVLVEDFQPEKIDFDLSLPDAPVRVGDTPPLSIDARFLFGAPGADLSVSGNVRLSGATSVDGWPGFVFGRYDANMSPQSDYFGGDRTDAQGQAVVDLDIPMPDVDGVPLELTATVQLADGSARPVERQITVPVRPATPVIGIKPMFEEVAAEGSDAAFQVIALDPTLQPMGMDVKWTLNRVETRYQWYQLYGNWNWEPITRRTRIATGTATLGADPLTLSHAVDWGEYELIVERTGGDYVSAAYDFSAGWYGGADSADSPDRLEVSLDQPSYAIDDTARFRIVAPEAGIALVEVMSDRLISRQVVSVDPGESMVPLQITGDWGTGAYVTATYLRPVDGASDGHTPIRALGIAHAAVDPGAKQLQVTIDAPDTTTPRQVQDVTVKVAGAAEEEVWLTVASVDLGILNMTGFKSPDPSHYYFGQRRLGMELRDVYGRLIDPTNGAMGTVRSGGDGGGFSLNSPPPTEDLMSVFSGPVQVGADGTAQVPVTLPAFNGTVHVMAVAWSKTGVGQADKDMIIRDPVVVAATVPQFLAPGDTSRIRIALTNTDAPAGQMELAVVQTGTGLSLGASPGRFELAKGAKAVFTVPVSATAVGDPELDIALTLPDGRILNQTLRMPVRANDPEVAETRRFALGKGNSFLFSQDVFAGLRPGTGRTLLSAGPLAKFDVPGLLSALDRYPYGCTEQVTSQAMPLLYLSAVAQQMGLGDGPAVAKRIDESIQRILTRQASSGGFGLWRAESGDFWLDTYVTDFLSQAKAQGYDVPGIAFRLAMDNLRNRIAYAPDFDSGGEDIAYALYVLAREGAASMSDLRYYADVKAQAFSTPMSAAQLGAALAAYGDQTRADAMFAEAARMIVDARPEPAGPVFRADFGTQLRDNAAVLTYAAAAGSTAVDTARLSDRIAQLVTARDADLSTQEATWTLLAAHELVTDPAVSGLTVDGQPVTGPFVEMLRNDEAAGERNITATGNSATDITLTTFGIPETPPAAGGYGYGIERAYYTMEGEKLDGNAFAVGDRFVTVITVNPFEDGGARLMINDPLPAGVEIDNPSLLRSGDIGALDWLQPSETEHAEFRSDRFLAAVNQNETDPITLAYVARAVSAGDYRRPAASVADMYRPRFRAHTDTTRVTVAE
ncbi:MG2 domain-containing protein [Chachezhania sediminis]|uniref:MG2 domain-containing protein n=1 Tax=Chachezhania sediminis TaxID=2599291 RepID=UPI001E4ECEC1|nr:MG2 domain-containing protein [Chachezhania sediminis]